MDKTERRIFAIDELRVEKDADKGTTLTGYAAVFDTLSVDLGGFRETIAKGTFSESLQGDVRALWNHDSNHVLGRTKSGTLKLAEDAKGLRVEIHPPESAAPFVESIRRGDVDQMSFGFKTVTDEWETDENGQTTRTLLKADLYDVSPVTFPAYPATEVSARAEIYGYIPDIPDTVRAHGSDIAEQEARARMPKRRVKKQDLYERKAR
jgi:HK97 family phage prohead protease